MPEQESLPPWADLPPVSPQRAAPPPVSPQAADLGPWDEGDEDAPHVPPRAPGSRAQRGAERGAARRRRRWLITIAALVVVAVGYPWRCCCPAARPRPRSPRTG